MDRLILQTPGGHVTFYVYARVSAVVGVERMPARRLAESCQRVLQSQRNAAYR